MLHLFKTRNGVILDPFLSISPLIHPQILSALSSNISGLLIVVNTPSFHHLLSGLPKKLPGLKLLFFFSFFIPSLLPHTGRLNPEHYTCFASTVHCPHPLWFPLVYSQLCSLLKDLANSQLIAQAHAISNFSFHLI
jgi:hypothetical protein